MISIDLAQLDFSPFLDTLDHLLIEFNLNFYATEEGEDILKKLGSNLGPSHGKRPLSPLHLTIHYKMMVYYKKEVK